jgi:hypothetical protein
MAPSAVAQGEGKYFLAFNRRIPACDFQTTTQEGTFRRDSTRKQKKTKKQSNRNVSKEMNRLWAGSFWQDDIDANFPFAC